MKIYKIMIVLLVVTLILSSCSSKELTKEEQYQQGLEYFRDLKLDEAKDIFLNLGSYENSSNYFYQIVNLQTIWHLDKVVSIDIQEEYTIAFVLMDNGDLYLYHLKDAEIYKKDLIEKGGN